MNSVGKIKTFVSTPHRRNTTVSSETNPLNFNSPWDYIQEGLLASDFLGGTYIQGRRRGLISEFCNILLLFLIRSVFKAIFICFSYLLIVAASWSKAFPLILLAKDCSSESWKEMTPYNSHRAYFIKPTSTT